MTARKSDDRQSAALVDVDRLVHEPARLAILVVLYVLEYADSTFLMNQTGLSWGNLSSHMSKLEEAGYIGVEKQFAGKKPQTVAHLTDTGRAAFRAYRQQIRELFDGLPD